MFSEMISCRSLVAVWAVFFFSGNVAAQPAETPTEAESTPQPRVVPAARRSPRATIQTFLDAMEEDHADQAVECLDLSYLEAVIRSERGRELAQELFYCMRLVIEARARRTAPDDPDQPSPYVWFAHHTADITLTRISEGGAEGEWRFSSTTLAGVVELTTALRKNLQAQSGRVAQITEALPLRLWIREKIPDQLERRFIVLEYWQWFGLFGLALIGVILDQLTVSVMGAAIGRKLQSGHIVLERKLRRSTMRPFGLLIMTGSWWLGIRFLLLPDKALILCLGAIKFLTAFAGVWIFYRLVDLLAGYLQVRAAKTENKFDDLLVPLVRKTLKIFVTIFGLVFIAEFMGWSLTSVLTGLGIGGLAFAFAAKETLGNFFGSITVLLDRPFEIGDWVLIGDKEGTVESVGFRSTRLRTFYNSIITIPNADCVNTPIDNMGARRYRRIRCMISVLYSTTPEQLEAFCEGIRELIRRHPYTRKDYFHVYVNQFAASSIDILLYCFVETPDWSTELRERHRLFLDIIRLAQKLGVEFAFPTQTIHLYKEEAPAAPFDVGDTGRALVLGKQQAEAVMKSTLGESGHKPPPVTFE